VFVPRYGEEEARRAISQSLTYTEALRRLGMRAAGGNFRTIRRYAEEIWRIPVDHFDPDAARNRALVRRPLPLPLVLVEGSTYCRTKLKRRLYDEGLKTRVCELCGQDEIWHNRRMALILDHINGVADDNRLENLRIVCPNCAATLETHCGRQNRLSVDDEACALCGTRFTPRNPRQRYCSRFCGSRAPRSREPRPYRRKVRRPPYVQLLREIRAMGYLGVGRRYGVSDNAVRKWVRQYERERARPPDAPASTMAP
jgi:hypothetical protein